MMKKENLHEKMIKKFKEEKFKNLENLYFHPSYVLEMQLLELIKKADYEKAKNILDEINKLERANLAKDSLRSLKNSLIGSCTIFTRAIITNGVSPETAFNLSDVYIRQIEETNDKKKLEELEYEMLYSFIEELKKEKKLFYHLTINKALEYIHHHIFDQLSLELIAQKLDLNSAYLSNLFKSEVGITITEYINRAKVEDSKYFLIHSNLPIPEVASLFNFCNQSYYTKIFKKYTNLTPKEYREKGLSSHEINNHFCLIKNKEN